MAIDTDNFDRADNPTSRGSNWTSVSGFSSGIASNESTPNTSGDPCLAYRNTITPGAAQYAKITLRSPLDDLAGGGVGPAIRIQTGADTCYHVICNSVASERFQVYRRIAGFDTSIFGTTAIVPAVNDIVELRVNADFDLELYVNSILRAGPFTDTDANKIASGRVGDWGLLVNQFPHWDNWEGGDMPVAGNTNKGRHWTLLLKSRK